MLQIVLFFAVKTTNRKKIFKIKKKIFINKCWAMSSSSLYKQPQELFFVFFCYKKKTSNHVTFNGSKLKTIVFFTIFLFVFFWLHCLQHLLLSCQYDICLLFFVYAYIFCNDTTTLLPLTPTVNIEKGTEFNIQRKNNNNSN